MPSQPPDWVPTPWALGPETFYILHQGNESSPNDLNLTAHYELSLILSSHLVCTFPEPALVPVRPACIVHPRCLMENWGSAGIVEPAATGCHAI